MSKYFLLIITYFYVFLEPIIPQLTSQIQLCQKGQYDNMGLFCDQCKQSECTQCIYGVCLQCQIGSQIIEQGSQISCLQSADQCQKGYYFESKAQYCFKCLIPGCDICNSSQSCQTCQDGFQLSSSKICILNQLSESSNQSELKYSLQKAILNESQYEIDYFCPNTYQQIQESKMCQQMDVCSSSLNESNQNFQDDIIDFIIDEKLKQSIVISQKQIGIYNLIDMKLMFWLIDLNQALQINTDNEIIMNAIKIKNILNVFTNEALYVFSIFNQTIVSKIEFSQDTYNYDQKKRFYISEENYLYYLLYDSQQQDGILNVAQFQITYTINQQLGNDLIDEQSYSIKLKKKIPFNTLPSGFFSINYSQKENIVLVTKQNQIFTIFIADLFKSFNSNSNQINDLDVSKFIVINNLVQEFSSILDQAYQDKSGQFIIYKTLITQILILQVSINSENMEVDVQQSTLDLPQQNEIQNLVELKGQISKIYGDIAIIGTKYNLYDQNYSIQLTSIDQSISGNYKIVNNIVLLKQILSINLISVQLEQVDENFVVMQLSQFLLIGIIEDNQIKIILNFKLSTLTQFQLKLLKGYTFKKQINDAYINFKDLCLSQQNIFACFRLDSQNNIQILQSQFQLGYEYFNSKLQVKIGQSPEQQMLLYNSLANELLIISYKIDQQLLVIHKIDTNSNYIIQIQYVQFEYDCTISCLIFTHLDSSYSNLFLFLLNQMMIMNYDNLQIISQVSYAKIAEFKYPCFIILDTQQNIIVYKIKRDQLQILYQTYSEIEQPKFFLQNLSTDQNTQIFLIQPKYYYLSILVYSDGVFVNQIQFYDYDCLIKVEDNLTFSILLYNYYSAFIQTYSVDLSNKKIILNEEYQNFEIDSNFVDHNFLILSQGMRLLVILAQRNSQLQINIFNLNDQASVQTLETQYQEGQLAIQAIQFQNIFYDEFSQCIIVQFRNVDINNYYINSFSILIYQFDQANNQFNTAYLQRQIFFTTLIEKSFQQSQYILLQNQYTSTLTTILNNNKFIALSLGHPLKQFQTQQQLDETLNILLVSSQNSFQIIKNLLNSNSMKQIDNKESLQYNYNWWLYELYGIIITVIDDFNSKTVQFQYLDNLEQAVSPLLLNLNDRAFWFNNYEILLVCSQNKITSYQIKQNQLIVGHTYEHTNELVDCFQTKINSFVFCLNQGAFNFINKQFYQYSFQYQEGIEFVENEMYVFFQNQLLFETSKGTFQEIKLNDVGFEVKNIKLSTYYNGQGFYIVPSQYCMIFSLPDFYSIVSYDLIDENNSYTCDFNAELSIYSVYSNEVLNSYQFPVQYSGQTKLVLSMPIPVNLQSYFSPNCYIFRKYFICSQYFTINNDDQYLYFLLIEIQNGEITQVNNFIYSGSQQYLIADVWEEKDLILSNKVLLSITDVQINLSFDNRKQVNKQQQIQYSKHFNYIAYETNDSKQIVILDVSEIFPINTSIGQIYSRYSNYSINFFTVNDINSQKKQMELIYFNLQQGQLIGWRFITSNIAQSQGRYIQQIEQSIALDVSSVFNQILQNQEVNKQVIQTQYKIYLLYKDQTYKIYVLNFQCQAVIFGENHKIYEIINLEQYQCKLIVSKQYNSPSLSNQQIEPNKIFLISQDQSVLSLFYQNGIIQQTTIFTDAQQDQYKISNLISISLENIQVTVIVYQKFINKMVVLMNSQTINSFKHFVLNGFQNIYTYALEVINEQFLLFLGTEQNILIYQIIWDQINNNIEILLQSNLSLQNKGQHQLLYSVKYESSDNSYEKVTIVLTTQNRIMIFQNSQNDLLKFNLVRENLKHIRGQHQIQIHKNPQNMNTQILSLFSQLQVSLYSLPSLQFIARVEEKSSIQISSVHIVFSAEIIVIVCDQEEIQVFVLQRFNKEKKLILQNQIQISQAQIYHVVDMNLSNTQASKMVALHGVSSGGYFIVYYSLLDNKIFQNNNQDYLVSENLSCLNVLQLENKIQHQEIQLNQIIKQNKDLDQNVIPVSIQLSSSMQIFIPRQMIYLTNLYLNKKFDYKINLMNFSATPKQYLLDTNQNMLQSILINNGILHIDSDFLFQNLKSLVFENVTIRFCLNNCKLTIQNVKEVIFENVSFVNQSIDIQDRQNQISIDGQLQINPLIQFKNCSSILILGVKLNNLKIKLDIFAFEDVDDFSIEKVRCQDSIIIGSLLSFKNQFQTLSQINIENILLKNSLIINIISILNVNVLSIQNIQIQQINNVSTNQSQIEKLFHQIYQTVTCSLIKTILVLQSASITQIISRNQIFHQSLIDYKNFHKFNNQTFTTGTSILKMKNIYGDNCFFQNYAIQIQENEVQIQQVRFISSNNTSIFLNSIQRGLTMIDLQQLNNFYYENPIIQITNSQAQLNTILLSKNQVISQYKKLNSILITNTTFYIDKLSALENKSPSSFLFISGDNTNKKDFLLSSQEYLINNCEISNCNNNALILQNILRLSVLNSKFNKNSLEKQVEEGGAIQLQNIGLCTIKNTQIKNNYAKKYGGGISMRDSDLHIISSLIQSNTALIGGGLRFLNQNNQLPTKFFSCEYQSQIINNIAEFFGNNIASIPHKIKFLSSLDNLKISLNQYSTSFLFSVYGVDGELIKYNQNNRRLLEETEDSEFLNQFQQFELISISKSVQIENQVRTYNIEKNIFNITCNLLDYGYQQLIDIQSQKTQISEFYNKRRLIQFKILSNPAEYFDFTISIQLCQVGQLIQPLQQNLYQCYQCNDNTYSIQDPYNDISFNKCQGCPIGAISCQGDKIQLEEGYWKQEGTYFVIYCRNKPQKCTQKVQQNKLKGVLGNGCVEGGYGHLCESCDYNNIYWGKDQDDLYVKTNMYECINCKEEGISYYITQVIIIIAFLACFCYQIFEEILKNILYLQCLILKNLNLVVLNSSFVFRHKHTAILKMILSYLQIICLIIFNQPKTSSTIKNIILFFGNILELLNYLFDCFFVKTGLQKTINMVYLRLIWALILSLLFLFLLIFLSLAICKLLKIENRFRNIKNKIFVKLYLILLPGLISQLIGTIWCRYINQEFYVLRDIQFNCFDDQYLIFNLLFSIPILISLILYPLFLLKKLSQNKFQLNHIQFYISYGFIYTEYKEKLYYWQIVKIFKNILIYLVVELFSQMFEMMLTIVIILLIFYMKFQQIHLPYKNSYIGDLDIFSQLCLIFTIFCLIIQNNTISDWLYYCSFAFMSFINFVLVIRITNLLLSENSCPSIFFKFLQFFSFNFNKKFHTQFKNHKATNITRVTKNWRKIQSIIRQKKTQQKRLLTAINIPTQRYIQEIEEQNEQNSLAERQNLGSHRKTQSDRFQINSLARIPEDDYNIQIENISIKEDNINQLKRSTVSKKQM